MKTYLIGGEPWDAKDLASVVKHINERLPVVQKAQLERGLLPLSEVSVAVVGPRVVLKLGVDGQVNEHELSAALWRGG